MIVASGFIEANTIEDVQGIISELNINNVEVKEINNDRIVFLIERETSKDVRQILDSLKFIDNVRNVYLAYFSLEGSDTE